LSHEQPTKRLISLITRWKKYVSDILELVAEWYPTMDNGKRPEDYTHGSSSLIWWQYNKGLCQNKPPCPTALLEIN
jgi:hypothetical protein